MTLSQVVAKISAKPLSNCKDFREEAAAAAVEAFGFDAVRGNNIFINMAALARAMGTRPLVYDLRSDALDLIEQTDLRSAPAHAPRILSDSFIIQAAGEPLFASTTDIGVYQIPDGRIGLIGLTGRGTDGGAMFSLWRPHWSNDDFKTPEITSADSLTLDVEGYESWAQSAIRFLLIYGLLLEADKAPMEVEKKQLREKKSMRKHDQGKGREGWSIRRVSLTTRQIMQRPAEPIYPDPSYEIKDGVYDEVHVSGHLAFQAYGPEWSLHRWIYVQEYDAWKWLKPGPRRVIVTK